MGGYEQTPPLQDCPIEHAFPQEPQLLSSDCVFTQVPPQFVSLLAQHLPLLHA